MLVWFCASGASYTVAFRALYVPYTRKQPPTTVDSCLRKPLYYNECPARDSNPEPTD